MLFQLITCDREVEWASIILFLLTGESQKKNSNLILYMKTSSNFYPGVVFNIETSKYLWNTKWVYKWIGVCNGSSVFFRNLKH